MLSAIAAAAHVPADGFTYANALSSLLTTESLLFAALGLAANLSVPGGRRIRRLPVSAHLLGRGAVGGFVVIAAGAAAAWLQIFISDFPSRPADIVIAVSLIVAIVIQPVLAVLLGLGLRTAR